LPSSRASSQCPIFLQNVSSCSFVEIICVLLGYNYCLSIYADGRSDRPIVLWKENIKCKVLNYSINFIINLHVEDMNRGNGRLTCFYGFLKYKRQKSSWDIFRELRDMSTPPWCIISDFNYLLDLHPHLNWFCLGLLLMFANSLILT
jgi:hypothetical protein